MKIVITGGKGMLGRTLLKELSAHEILVADLPEWDITQGEEFKAGLLAAKPDLVIHCAAMTNVDGCESNSDAAFLLNETGSRNVALACKACSARLIAISTDYVFSGDASPETSAWTESDMPAPRTVYGASKLAGERAVLQTLPDAVVLRIAWLYGAGGPSFVHTMAKLGSQDGAPLKVVDDQHGNPTSTKVVADAIKFIAERSDIKGIVHCTCEGRSSWYEFATEIFRHLNLPRKVEPCTSAEFPRPAPRPANSALEKKVLASLGYHTTDWKAALSEFLDSEFPEKKVNLKL